jgi:hypothetical protein
MFTSKEKLTEIRRELKHRHFVYPKLIGSGRLTQQAADKQVAIMTAIRGDYQKQVEAEEKAAEPQAELGL